MIDGTMNLASGIHDRIKTQRIHIFLSSSSSFIGTCHHSYRATDSVVSRAPIEQCNISQYIVKQLLTVSTGYLYGTIRARVALDTSL
jgi:hypothetical protein